MNKQDDSFDGTFTDNIRSATYKNQFTSKKHKMIINVSCTHSVTKKLNMQSSNISQKNINGGCKLTPSSTSTSISAGQIITSKLTSSHACNLTKKSITTQVHPNTYRNGHSLKKKQSRHGTHAIQKEVSRVV